MGRGSNGVLGHRSDRVVGLMVVSSMVVDDCKWRFVR